MESNGSRIASRFRRDSEHQRNYIRLLFMHPLMKQLYNDWESVARFGVSLLRMKAAQEPEDATRRDTGYHPSCKPLIVRGLDARRNLM